MAFRIVRSRHNELDAFQSETMEPGQELQEAGHGPVRLSSMVVAGRTQLTTSYSVEPLNVRDMTVFATPGYVCKNRSKGWTDIILCQERRQKSRCSSATSRRRRQVNDSTVQVACVVRTRR